MKIVARKLIEAMRVRLRRMRPSKRPPAMEFPDWVRERLERPPCGVVQRPYPICEIQGCTSEAHVEARFGDRVLFVCAGCAALARGHVEKP